MTTENRFHRELLKSLKHTYYKSGTGGDKVDKAINLIQSLVYEKQEHRFLLFIDEAQNLFESQLKYLMHLHNELKPLGIRLVVVLVGQPELRYGRKILLQAGKNHLVSRFFCCEIEFHGPNKESHLRTILEHVDFSMEWPIGSGITYTQHFAPEAHANGWRLSHQSDAIWAQITKSMAQRSLTLEDDLPMQAIVALIRKILRENYMAQNKELKLTTKNIKDVVESVSIRLIENHLEQISYEKQRAIKQRLDLFRVSRAA